MKDKLIENYENTEISIKEIIKKQNELIYNFVGGPTVEIKGYDDKKYLVNFIDNKTNKSLYKDTISNNMWTRCSVKYYVDWRIEVNEIGNADNKTEIIFSPSGNRVYISLDSSSLGDTLAWLPAVDEFRKKWNCKMICSTFLNKLFVKNYPDIEFIEPGSPIKNLYAMFNIGWYYKEDNTIDLYKNVSDPKHVNLQKTAFDILGVEYKETRPLLDKDTLKRNIEGKYVCIAPHGTSLAKYWNYPGGWQILIGWLNKNGYKVVYISQEPIKDDWHSSKLGGKLTDVIDKSGSLSLEDRMSDLYYAEYFIGIGSGLSWLSWAMGTQTVMISGFSYPWTEFSDNCIRIFNNNANICTGCFNKHRLDASDWKWCPEKKGTPQQFECTKTIYPQQIIGWMLERKNEYIIARK